MGKNDRKEKTGVLDPNPLMTGFLIVTLIGLAAGIYSALHGHHLTFNISREIPWGLLHSTFAFLSLTAIGLCIVSAISYAYGVTILKPLRKRAVFLCILSITAGLVVILFALENPWRMLVYNAVSPNLTSNVWWLSTLFGIMAGTMFLEFSSFLTQEKSSKFRIGFIGAVAAVGANSNLGALFTASFDFPVWHGSQLIILFLASSVLCGTAVVSLSAIVAIRLKKKRIPDELDKALQSAGTIMMFSLIILIGIMISRYYSLLTGDDEPGRITGMALFTGPLAISFWFLEITIGHITPLVLLAVSKAQKINIIAVSALLILVGTFFQRYNLVVAGQIVPAYPDWNSSQVYLSYFPSIFEILIALGSLALCVAGYFAAERYIGSFFQK